MQNFERRLDSSLSSESRHADVKPAEWKLVFRGWRAMDGPESSAEHGRESGRPPKIGWREGSRRPGAPATHSAPAVTR